MPRIFLTPSSPCLCSGTGFTAVKDSCMLSGLYLLSHGLADFGIAARLRTGRRIQASKSGRATWPTFFLKLVSPRHIQSSSRKLTGAMQSHSASRLSKVLVHQGIGIATVSLSFGLYSSRRGQNTNPQPCCRSSLWFLLEGNVSPSITLTRHERK